MDSLPSWTAFTATLAAYLTEAEHNQRFIAHLDQTDRSLHFRHHPGLALLRADRRAEEARPNLAAS